MKISEAITKAAELIKAWALSKFAPTVTEGGDTLTWDGNTEGLVSVDGVYYKVSDAVPTKDDFGNGLTWILDGEEVTLDAATMQGAFGEDGTLICGALAVIPVDGYDADGTIFSNKGIYFMLMDGSFISSLTIPGYTGFTTETLDPAYLPEHTHKWDDIEDPPFGDVEAVLIEEQTVTFTDSEASVTALALPSVGDSVTVEWDGTEYTCQAFDFNGAATVGNGVLVGLEDTGEPFLIMFVSAGMIFVVTTDSEKTSATVKVTGTAVVKLNSKYTTATKTFYLNPNDSSDVYLYVDAAATTKATANDVMTAFRNVAVNFSVNDIVYYGLKYAATSGTFFTVQLWTVNSEGEIFETYCTSEYTATEVSG